MDANAARQRRKYRKFILQQQKSKRRSIIQKGQTSSNTPSLQVKYTDENITFEEFCSIQRSSISSRNSFIINTYPLSCITNGIQNITTIPQTPLSSKRQYSDFSDKNSIDANSATQRRKYRKYILEQQKATRPSNIEKGQSSTNNTQSLQVKKTAYGNENMTFDDFFSNPRSTIYSTTSNIISRSPLSCITNGIPNFTTTPQTPFSSTRRYSETSNVISSNNHSTIIQASAGTHRKKRNTSNIPAIPFVDLTEYEQPNRQRVVHSVTSGLSKDYFDHGDQTVCCEICHAKLWKDEALRSKNKSIKSFSLCCGNGKVQLPLDKKAPSRYEDLFRSLDTKSKHFTSNLRRYNSMFSFTSMGGKIDSTINRGNAPYVFRISGQNYHSMGSLLPTNGQQPKFSQLYIYDTDNEISNRQNSFRAPANASSSTSQSIDIQLIQELKSMLDSTNELVKNYRMARDIFHENPNVDLKLRIIGKRVQDGRTYNLPTASEVAALIIGDFEGSFDKRDIIVQTSSGRLQPISELHPSYLALQYPLLFPYGEDGYRTHILHRGLTEDVNAKRQYTTMREFFAYKIQDRDEVFSLILNSRRLFQQFLVDGYTMIESERLFYIRREQKVLKRDTYDNIRNLQQQGNSELSNVGQRVILPSSFTGGSRYMMQNYLDAMSLCKWFGYPDYFITVTCNPKWPEIRRFLQGTTLKAEDRPDILCRLFKIKLDSLIKDIKDNKIFGKVQAVVYTIEFQKRGLPHSHICLFMHSDNKVANVEHIDPLISAEIPNINEDPELYALVKDFMIHGPCGHHNPKCPCMVDKKCSKKFPKRFVEKTTIDTDGYAQYRRRDDGNYVEKNGVKLDNRYVVPYNKMLLKRYEAHINVEWCNQAGSIKYLFKYINKGPDRATIVVDRGDKEGDNEQPADEIKQFYDCRYLSACEATWRIFGYDVHYRTPSVMRLPFHLPGQQQIVFGANDDIDDVVNKNSVSASMFNAWMECNRNDPEARNLTYVEFPTKYVWKANTKCWQPRKQNFSIGRIHPVPPSSGEVYYLRILLNKVRGPRSFKDIRTVNGEVFPSFREACYALGLLDDDNEYIDAIKEASHAGFGHYLRSLFAMMLLNNTLSMPLNVWNKTWEYLSDGILYNQQRLLKSPGLSLSEDQIKNLTLFEIEKLLLDNNSSLKRFSGMPYPDDDSLNSSNNRHIMDELNYDRDVLKAEFDNLFAKLTYEQRNIFDIIMKAVKDKEGGVFFVYGYGGTGKTFLWKTLSAAIRSAGEIVLNVASSGIASLLMSGGRTAHSRFGIPLNLTEICSCHIKPNTDLANLMQISSLIIWDEAPMTHRHAFEALDRSLNDIIFNNASEDNVGKFGGKVVVFGGDFRQILPVVPNGSRQDIVNASLCSSNIWSNCKVLRLTKNLRLTTGNNSSDVDEIRSFAEWLLDVGEGKLGGSNDGDAVIDIPDDMLINAKDDPISSLIEFVYPSMLENFQHAEYFQDKAILAPTNEDVQQINDYLLSKFPGEEKEYLSSDSLCQEEFLTDRFDTNLYSPDNLNGLKISGLPNHKLVLKVGVPIMLLRNVDQKMCLCNGTRLQVLSLGKHVIEAKIISGGNIGYRALIPRIALTPSDKRIPFKFQRRQFPISVSFAMTINKSQGQSLSKVGLFLRQPVFSHGQLYVALSRVKSRKGLKLLILDKDSRVTNKTSNVVYKEIFTNL